MHDQTILKIREFNRFYLSAMNFYENSYRCQDGTYSLTEARVLYELSEYETCSADAIVRKLHIDKGYLSRIIRNFESRGLLERQKSKTDARSYQIRLTGKGHALIQSLSQESNRGIEPLLRGLSAEECRRLELAMHTIQELLTKGDKPNENHTV